MFGLADTIRKQAFTQIATIQRLRQSQQKKETIDYAKIRYSKAYNKAKINSRTEDEISIDNLTKMMAMHKFDHGKYDPNLLEEHNKADIIAILSKQ